MIVELVNTTTADGMRLDGALHSADAAIGSLPLDALLCLHGVGGNYYGSSLFQRLTPRLLAEGLTIVWANTRGHDGVHTARVNSGSARLGAAYETVDDCRLDITAWMDLLQQRDQRRVGVLGHSLGAIKAVYSAAYDPHLVQAALIAVSPPRLSFSCFRQGPSSANFFACYTLAKQHVEEGRGEELIEATFPHPLLITAAGFIDKYGPPERYNITKFAHRVGCPMLFTYGEAEVDSGNLAFAGVPEALRSLPPEGQQLDVVTIPAADHNYTGRDAALAEVMMDWLRKLDGFTA